MYGFIGKEKTKSWGIGEKYQGIIKDIDLIFYNKKFKI